MHQTDLAIILGAVAVIVILIVLIFGGPVAAGWLFLIFIIILAVFLIWYFASRGRQYGHHDCQSMTGQLMGQPQMSSYQVTATPMVNQPQMVTNQNTVTTVPAYSLPIQDIRVTQT